MAMLCVGGGAPKDFFKGVLGGSSIQGCGNREIVLFENVVFPIRETKLVKDSVSLW